MTDHYINSLGKDGNVTIEANAPRIRPLLIGGTVWVAAWCAGLYGSVAALGFGHRGFLVLELLLIAWLVIWLAGGLTVLALLLWGWSGREKLTIDKGEVILQRLVFGLGRKQVFSRTAFFGAKSKWSMIGVGAGKVKFDHRGRSHSFGLGLGDDEAVRLAEELGEVLN